MRDRIIVIIPLSRIVCQFANKIPSFCTADRILHKFIMIEIVGVIGVRVDNNIFIPTTTMTITVK